VKHPPSRLNTHLKDRLPESLAAQLVGLVKPGQSLDLLKALHILTADGKINQDSRRKLKQVNHLVQFIEPLLLACLKADNPSMTLVDHGSGKSYLGFILYDLFLRQQPHAQVWGIEQRPELISSATALAKQLEFNAMRFFSGSAKDAASDPSLPTQVDIVTALHACDTATDDAITFGLAKKTQYFVLVPCCQAEVATQLRQYKNVMLGQTPLAELWRHPLHTREMGTQLTNVLRTLRLQAAGYDVTVTELVGWEHSLKNELIIANYNSENQGGKTRAAQERLQALLTTFGLASLTNRFSSNELTS
jgi:hypothetical protein